MYTYIYIHTIINIAIGIDIDIDIYQLGCVQARHKHACPLRCLVERSRVEGARMADETIRRCH